jgi:heme-degrading monooxygenase HmoA
MTPRRLKTTNATQSAEYFRIFSYQVASAQKRTFQKTYGPNGPWARLFAQADGYLGTKLLKRTSEENEYVTIDAWISETAWLAFIGSFRQRYEQLSSRCRTLYQVELEVGSFGMPAVTARRRPGSMKSRR